MMFIVSATLSIFFYVILAVIVFKNRAKNKNHVVNTIKLWQASQDHKLMKAVLYVRIERKLIKVQEADVPDFTKEITITPSVLSAMAIGKDAQKIVFKRMFGSEEIMGGAMFVHDAKINPFTSVDN